LIKLALAKNINMKKSFFKISLPIIALSAIMASCYPGGAEYVSDLDVTYTFILDQNYNWADKSKKVYFMPDTVMDASDPKDSPKPILSAKEILSTVKQELNANGFIEETDFNNALNTDFIVTVSRVRSNNFYYSYWGGYWGWYYYPPIATVSNYKTGSLTIEIINTAEIDTASEKIPGLWQGVSDGLFEGTSYSIEARGKASIQQMFKQSPYLNRN
jgi:hypothetical protein